MKNNNKIIAKEGYPFIIYSSLLTILLFLAALQFSSYILDAVVFISLLLTIFVISFFRNPERFPKGGENDLVAPADGTVIVVENAEKTPLGYEALKISIFMSVFNVHINRAPLSGKVVAIDYIQGKFLDARDGNASSENERNSLVLETKNGIKIAFVQIAGLIARRIICYPKVGDILERGKRYGLIRFGSRVDIYLPKDTVSLVKIGDKTVAGETVIAQFS